MNYKKVIASFFLGVALLGPMTGAGAAGLNRIDCNGTEYTYLYTMADYQFAYIGNIRTMKLHVPGCRHAASTTYQNLVGFGSRQAAINLGFVPCKVCKP